MLSRVMLSRHCRWFSTSNRYLKNSIGKQTEHEKHKLQDQRQMHEAMLKHMASRHQVNQMMEREECPKKRQQLCELQLSLGKMVNALQQQLLK